ncbi:winged helix-turn-helix domain-containing protein [Dinghuibacter silviterrae]|uniref:Winged helix DNA-binding protein n=1 Tax=Dinghuibacter silviterrae TaxID=1539049 RepID=A0A4R8DHG9_9BACT|nr:transcriptional regulator [Dinghuibacter silviterrae]TDW96400.1 winged helix DNA-binding protein [Dinghuibacter silviterrae]
MYRSLDPVLNTPVRLAVVSALIPLKQAGFSHLLEVTGTTQGNLSQQIRKLQEAGYIEIIKEYQNNYPHTLCKLTPEGKRAFERYVKDIKKYLHL